MTVTKATAAFSVTDRVKCVCSNCHKPFSERASRLKTGYQMQCPNCMRLITFESGSEDPNIRRSLKAARDIRIAAEGALVAARMAAQQANQNARD
jgi:DNA-directed RNA polymerase subunit RPC12/RpoP